MARMFLAATVLLASLPVALCEAACVPAPEARAAGTREAHAAASPCHGTPEAPVSEPAGPHRAGDCARCHLDLVAGQAPPAAAAAFAAPLVALAAAPLASPPRPEARAANPPREPPGPWLAPFAHHNAPLLS